MTTLRDIWVRQGKTSRQVAKLSHCSVPTLYKLNRREDDAVAFGIIKRVCNVLGINVHEYLTLDACPMADRYREKL